MFQLLGLSLKLFFSRFGTVMGITALVLVPVLLVQLAGSGVNLMQILGAANPLNVSSGMLLTGSAICLGIFALVLGLLLPWMEGALTHNTIERVLGRSPGLRDSYKAARPSWGALFGSRLVHDVALALLSALIGVLSGAGFLFAMNVGNIGVDAGSTLAATIAVVTAAICAPVSIVIGVFTLLLAVNWSLRAPVVIGESAGTFEALSRSNELVKGNRWRMIFRLLPVALIDLIFAGLPAFALSALQGGGALRNLAADNLGLLIPGLAGLAIVGALVQLFSIPFTIIYVTLNYLDLRSRKENLAGQLAGQMTPTSVVALPEVQPLYASDGPFAPKPTAAQRAATLVNRVRTEGESLALLLELGGAYREVGDYGGAFEVYNRAHALAPENAEIALNLAIVHRALKNLPAARAAMADYVRLETNADQLSALRANAQWRELMPPAGEQS